MNIVVDPPQRHTGLNIHSNQPEARESDEKSAVTHLHSSLPKNCD
jgi:hypothetical protein